MRIWRWERRLQQQSSGGGRRDPKEVQKSRASCMAVQGSPVGRGNNFFSLYLYTYQAQLRHSNWLHATQGYSTVSSGRVKIFQSFASASPKSGSTLSWNLREYIFAECCCGIIEAVVFKGRCSCIYLSIGNFSALCRTIEHNGHNNSMQ